MREIIKSAFAQLAGNKLRTFLTMLGMLIGVGSVIIILTSYFNNKNIAIIYNQILAKIQNFVHFWKLITISLLLY